MHLFLVANIATSSFLFLVVRHLLLEAMHLFLVANIATSSFLFLVVRHLLSDALALVTRSDALVSSSEHCY